MAARYWLQRRGCSTYASSATKISRKVNHLGVRWAFIAVSIEGDYDLVYAAGQPLQCSAGG